jgi:hypothetical protein
MPTETCWKCKQKKEGVKLCADDRLCPECDAENERALALTRRPSKVKDKNTQSVCKGPSLRSSANDGATSSSCVSASGSESGIGSISVPNEAVNVSSVFVGAASSTEATAVTKVIWNELLAYIHFFRNNSNAKALHQVVLRFFSPCDISAGKSLLVHQFSMIDGVGQFTVKRHNSVARQAHEAELDDVFGIFDVADAAQAFDGCLFVASKLDHLPKFGPEEINLGVVVDRQVKMDLDIQNLATSIQQMSGTSSGAIDGVKDGVYQQALQTISQHVDRRLEEFSSSIGARLDHLQLACTQLANCGAAQSQVRSSPPLRAHQQQPQADRSMNVVVFGVAEDRVASVWRQKVDDALSFISGHNVDVVDAFRVGRFVVDKTRPIIVKLRSVWDRRIIVSNSYKLKDFAGRIFVSPDEAPDVRRQRTFDRIKLREERAGKIVSVDNGILLVDGNPVFSLQDGNVIRHD